MKVQYLGFVFMAVFVLLLPFGIWWDYTIWSECRNSGHSIPYCLALLNRG